LLDQPTALYQELINTTVAHAGKAVDADLEDSVHRGGEALRRLLQEVAATISILRGEAISVKELQMRLEDRQLPIPRQLVQNWSAQADTATAVQELVINFYFKGNPELNAVKQRANKPGPKRVLTLDGGGIRGCLSLGYLQQIQVRVRRLF
jgi:hypothetical protein